MFFEIEFDKALSSNLTETEESSAYKTSKSTAQIVRSINTKDYYKILELEKNATVDDVKKSFRRLAVKYHPDKNRDNKKIEEKFKDITEAYDVLRNEHRKFKYDEYGITEVVSKWFPGKVSDEKFIIVTCWSENGGWLIEKIEWINKSLPIHITERFEKIITHHFNNLPKVGTFTAQL